jgi:pilus assembly protein Flp/PilA
MKNLVARFLNDESGAAAIEYALIAGLIALAIVGGAGALGTKIGAKFTGISNHNGLQ